MEEWKGTGRNYFRKKETPLAGCPMYSGKAISAHLPPMNGLATLYIEFQEKSMVFICECVQDLSFNIESESLEQLLPHGRNRRWVTHCSFTTFEATAWLIWCLSEMAKRIVCPPISPAMGSHEMRDREPYTSLRWFLTAAWPADPTRR